MQHLALDSRFRISLLIITCLEMLSFLGWYFPDLNRAVFLLIIALAIILAWRRLDLLVGVVIAELVIGAKGYLFSWPTGDNLISIRLGVFSVLVVGWLWHAWKSRRIEIRHSNTWPWYLSLLGIIGLGIGIAWWRDLPLANIFFDANGYLYFGLAPAVIHVWRDTKNRQAIWMIFWAAVVALCLKTLMLLVLFANQVEALPEIYRWVRDTRVYEITQQRFNFYRIFSQSQIFAMAALLLAAIPATMAWIERKRVPITTLFIIFLTSTTVIVSLSRSIWLALALVLCVGIGTLIRIRITKLQRIVSLISIALLLCIGEVLFLFLLVNTPNWLRSNGSSLSLGALVEDRVSTSNQAALQSRWSLLKPMWQTIQERPVLGSGFGQTVTYQSSDPRVVAETGGSYTTYSFEWGYLDLWLKLGVVGLAVYLSYIWRIARNGVKTLRHSGEERSLRVAWLLILCGLLAVHLTTPYLNHPLGIGLLLLCSLAFEPTNSSPSNELPTT